MSVIENFSEKLLSLHNNSTIKLRCYLGPNLKGNKNSYRLQYYSIGTENPTAPVTLIIGGVHGLEKIGSDLVQSYFESFLETLKWDASLNHLLSETRLIFLPLLNPTGYFEGTRSNFHGVDLMRNSPIDAVDKTIIGVSGQNWSSKLPWFRGNPKDPEIENKFLFECFQKEAEQSQSVISIDCHSGFGFRDRIWFPYSFKKEPFEKLPELHALIEIFEKTYPYHVYKIEPQSNGYLINGDIWDYLFLTYQKVNPNGSFIPITLEMGSWNWVKKNPLQIFSKWGAFNPIKSHRKLRTFRRHVLLFQFLIRIQQNPSIWNFLTAEKLNEHSLKGLKKWYPTNQS